MMLTPKIYLTIERIKVTRRKQSCQGGSKSTKLDLNVKHTLCLQMCTQQPGRGAQNQRNTSYFSKKARAKNTDQVGQTENTQQHGAYTLNINIINRANTLKKQELTVALTMNSYFQIQAQTKESKESHQTIQI